MNIFLRRVEGGSMTPYFTSGQLVVCRKTTRVKVGHVVIFEHEGREKIKKVTKLSDHSMYVHGSNLSSTDSRTFGWVRKSSVVGVVVWPRPNIRESG